LLATLHIFTTCDVVVIRQKLVRRNKQSEGMKQQQTDGSGFASFLKSKALQ